MQNLVNRSTCNSSFGLHAGLASSVPVVIWFLLQHQIYPDSNPWAPTLAEAVQALWILQAIAITLVLPWYAWRYHWKNNLLQSATLIAIPLPVYSICLLSSAVSSSALVQGLGFLALLAAGLIVLIKLMDKFVSSVQAKALIRPTVQLGCAIFIWSYRDLWLSALLN